MGLDDGGRVERRGLQLLELEDDAGAGEGAENATEFGAFPAPFEAAEPLAAHSRPAGQLRLRQSPTPALVADQHSKRAGGTNEQR